MSTTTTLRRLEPGDRVQLRLPWSEVCMHMHVQDQVFEVELLPNGTAQLHKDGHPFSIPITTGEAGIYHDAEGPYCYPAAESNPNEEV